MQTLHTGQVVETFLFSLSSSHGPPVAHTSVKYKCKIHWWTVCKMGRRICTARLCWQPCQPVFLCCIMLVWVRSASDSDPCGSTTDTPFGSSAPVPLHKWASVKIEHVQMAGELFHISLFATIPFSFVLLWFSPSTTPNTYFVYW